MHNLVPSLILENFSQGNMQGEFPCTGLFVDISGFTKVTESLMGHGQHGAEVMANIMRTVFNPPLHSVFAHGGFITNFAGDAFTAVFPFSSHGQAHPAHRALAAGWQIQSHLQANALQHTAYGVFEFSIKVGIASGEAYWGILKGEEEKRAAFYFQGSAINGCAQAEHHAQAGDVIVNQAAYDTIKFYVLARPITDHWRITQNTATLPEPEPVEQYEPDVDLMSWFFPKSLVEQEITGEFRQVLSLFINLQGTPTHDQLNRFVHHLFNLQERYGGLLNRIDFADKGCHMLLFWGAHQSYEYDINHAMDFILALKRISEIPIRAGITYRIAHAGPIGSELAEEYTCYGRGVNLAARHMTSAGWDEIWLDGEIARRVQREFSTESLGEKTFKGFAYPQPVFLLTGRAEDQTSAIHDRPLVGRSEELHILQEAVQPIFAGHFAGVVTVVGEAGIGKSRLIQELLDPITSSGDAAVFLCQADEIIRQSLNPFRYFLRRYFSQSPDQDETENKRNFESILQELLLSVQDEALGEELQRTYSFLGSLVGLYWEGSLYDLLTPDLRFENSLEALKTLFRVESKCQPVIIQLEDFHWLDDGSKEFLNRLTRNVEAYPFLLLVTSRDFVESELFAANTPVQDLYLKALLDDNLAELAAMILNSKPAPALIQLLEERAEGNPFFVEQMLLYLQENNLIDAIQETEGLLTEEIVIPTDVRALVTSRLDRLPVQVKNVVQHAAVLGKEFETDILLEMMFGDTAVFDSLSRGQEETIWVSIDQAHYLFHHALLRDAAYDMQTLSRLRLLHKQAAQAYEGQHKRDTDLEPRYPQIAYHFDKANERDAARINFGRAGYQAKDSYHNQDAIAYYGRALALTEKADFNSRYKYLSDRETIFQWVGNREEQAKDLDQLTEILQHDLDHAKKADLLLRKSAYALVLGNYNSAIDEAKQALDLAQISQQAAVEARAYHRWGRTLWQQGTQKDAGEILVKALDLAQKEGLQDLEAECHYDLGVVYRLLANYDDSLHSLNKALEVYKKLNDKQGLARCLNLLGIIKNEQGSLIESHDFYLQALDISQQTGGRYAETVFSLNIGNNLSDLGNYENARSFFNQASALAKETGDINAEAVSLDGLGLVSTNLNELKEAVIYFERALMLRESIDNLHEKGYVLTHLGYALAQSGVDHAPERILREALKIRQDLGEDAQTVDTMASLAFAIYSKEAPEEALSIVEDILNWMTENGTEGIEYPVQVYLICYRILKDVSVNDEKLTEKSRLILEQGYKFLSNQAKRIPDMDIRQRFLLNVPYNRELQSLWNASQ